MNNRRLDRALLLVILAAACGLNWLMFSIRSDFADMHVELSKQQSRVGTHRESIVPSLADPLPGQSPEG